MRQTPQTFPFEANYLTATSLDEHWAIPNALGWPGSEDIFQTVSMDVGYALDRSAGLPMAHSWKLTLKRKLPGPHWSLSGFHGFFRGLQVTTGVQETRNPWTFRTNAAGDLEPHELPIPGGPRACFQWVWTFA